MVVIDPRLHQQKAESTATHRTLTEKHPHICIADPTGRAKAGGNESDPM